MNTALPAPRRKVSLRLAHNETAAPALPRETLERLLARAKDAGFPLHHDPQVAAILAALRLRDDIPMPLYAAAAAVLSCVYEAAGEKSGS
ncbi:flagellar biosynthesis protein [Dyella sp.]|uniref:flagellar biosynthesis protein n=1 Tax=Dyella sp. TaxID=1869338 RepID=UPI002ED49843